MARDYRVINVGSHANPPGDMYERYFPEEIRHLAPKLVTREFPGEGVFECIELEGEYIRQLSTQTGIKLVDAQDIPFIKTFDEGFAGQRDPAARLADMDKDGVDADVMVSPGYPILLPKNRETRWGMMYAWNSWLAEMCAYDPERLIGIGEIPLWDIPRAIEEARRVKALGLKGVLMPAVPGYVGCWSSPADAPYTSPIYGPLWDALETLGLVMVVHADAAAATPGLENYDNAGVNMIINKTLPSEMIASLICGHVFRDHPGLKLLCVETGIGWMAHLVSWMDVLLREHPTMYPGMVELPSVQFRKHVYGSFLWDTIGIANRDLIGIDNIMWCNDYPHSYGPYPNSNSRIALELKDVPADEQFKILAGNAMRVFGLGQYAHAAKDAVPA
jgi:predicted TIM-barrel fold metal-dependent hydrolase